MVKIGKDGKIPGVTDPNEDVLKTKVRTL